MHESALHKGHRYATVAVEPTSPQVLWIGQGRSRQTVDRRLRGGAPHPMKRIPDARFADALTVLDQIRQLA